MKTIINSSILFVLFAFIALPSFAQKTQTSEIKVEGVCGMCKERIETAALIKGVKMATWNKETQMLKVIFKTKNATEEEIQKAIAAVGHDTEKVKASDEAYKKLPDCCAYRDGVKSH